MVFRDRISIALCTRLTLNNNYYTQKIQIRCHFLSPNEHTWQHHTDCFEWPIRGATITRLFDTFRKFERRNKTKQKKNKWDFPPTPMEDIFQWTAKQLSGPCWSSRILTTRTAPWRPHPRILSATFLHSHSTTDYDSLAVIKESLAWLSSKKNPPPTPTSSSSSSSSFPPFRPSFEERDEPYSSSIYISIYCTSFFAALQAIAPTECVAHGSRVKDWGQVAGIENKKGTEKKKNGMTTTSSFH